jgi:hypothetical protein
VPRRCCNAAKKSRNLLQERGLRSGDERDFGGEPTGQGLAQESRHAVGALLESFTALKVGRGDNRAHAVRQTIDDRVQDRQPIFVESP